MSESYPDYIPDGLVGPLEDKLARKQMITYERKSVLQPMQAIFVNHFFECNMDIVTAASRTGVTVKTAKQWVEHDGPVSDQIGLRLAELADRSRVTVDVIVQGLYDEATRLPANDEDKTVSHAARVAAWSHLAKFKGMFDKANKGNNTKVLVNINTSGDVNIAPPEEHDER